MFQLSGWAFICMLVPVKFNLYFCTINNQAKTWSLCEECFVLAMLNSQILTSLTLFTQPKPLKNMNGQICQICGDTVGLTATGDVFVACNECAFPVCRPCYEYERKDGNQSCPQCKTRYKRHKGTLLPQFTVYFIFLIFKFSQLHFPRCFLPTWAFYVLYHCQWLCSLELLPLTNIFSTLSFRES